MVTCAETNYQANEGDKEDKEGEDLERTNFLGNLHVDKFCSWTWAPVSRVISSVSSFAWRTARQPWV